MPYGITELTFPQMPIMLYYIFGKLDVISPLLTDDLVGCLEGELHDALIMVSCGQVEHTEDVLPARLDVLGLRVHHLSHTAHHHVTDGGRPEKEVKESFIRWGINIFFFLYS